MVCTQLPNQICVKFMMKRWTILCVFLFLNLCSGSDILEIAIPKQLYSSMDIIQNNSVSGIPECAIMCLQNSDCITIQHQEAIGMCSLIKFKEGFVASESDSIMEQHLFNAQLQLTNSTQRSMAMWSSALQVKKLTCNQKKIMQ